MPDWSSSLTFLRKTEDVRIPEPQSWLQHATLSLCTAYLKHDTSPGELSVFLQHTSGRWKTWRGQALVSLPGQKYDIGVLCDKGGSVRMSSLKTVWRGHRHESFTLKEKSFSSLCWILTAVSGRLYNIKRPPPPHPTPPRPNKHKWSWTFYGFTKLFCLKKCVLVEHGVTITSLHIGHHYYSKYGLNFRISSTKKEISLTHISQHRHVPGVFLRGTRKTCPLRRDGM